jgi:hypothetical protein
MAFPTTNLVAYWKLNETSGTRADQTANGNTLQDNNTVLYGTGKIDNAADFEATNTEYLSIAHGSQTGLELTNNDMSFSFWVNLETAVSASAVTIFSKNTGGAGNGYYCQHYTNAGSDKVWFTWENGSSDQAAAVMALGTGTWHHIVVTVDVSASGAGILFYLDGSAVTPVNVSGSNTTTSAGTRNFTMGGAASAGSFDGLIDEFGVWDRVLTSGEVTTLYNSGNGLTYPEVSGPANLKSYNTNLKANIKSINTNLIANVKSLNTNV